MASYRNTFLQISKCPACGFELHKRANNMGRDISEMLRKRDSVTRSRIHKIALMINDLIKIVDMYLDEEQRHYEENPSEDHIFHSLLNISLWVKENHTMKGD